MPKTSEQAAGIGLIDAASVVQILLGSSVGHVIVTNRTAPDRYDASVLMVVYEHLELVAIPSITATFPGHARWPEHHA